MKLVTDYTDFYDDALRAHPSRESLARMAAERPHPVSGLRRLATWGYRVPPSGIFAEMRELLGADQRVVVYVYGEELTAPLSDTRYDCHFCTVHVPDRGVRAREYVIGGAVIPVIRAARPDGSVAEKLQQPRRARITGTLVYTVDLVPAGSTWHAVRLDTAPLLAGGPLEGHISPDVVARLIAEEAERVGRELPAADVVTPEALPAVS